VKNADLYGVVNTTRDRRVAGATVTVENRTSSWTVSTNATGWYGYPNGTFAPGDYNVTVVANNNSLKPASGTVTLTDDRTRLDIELATATAPEFLAGSASPTGVVADQGVSLEIGVDDLEFRTASGDVVTVEFYLNGASVGTDTAQNVSLVSTTANLPTASTSTWWAVATDSFGRETRSRNFSVSTPSEIVLKNESEPSQNLTSLANATVTFYGADSTLERSITDETIDLSGVPTGTAADPTVAEFEADGYYARSLALDSLAEQQTAFLLADKPEVDTSEIIFELDDRTGQFPAENTTLSVKRPLTIDATTEYRTVTSGPFGSTQEFSSTLETGARYRLVVENSDGDRRVLGPYRVKGDDVAPLIIGRVRFKGDDRSTVSANLEHFVADSDNDGTKETYLRISYRDRSGATQEFRYRVINESSDTTVAIGNSIDPTTFSRTVKISETEVTGVTYNMSWTGVRKAPNGSLVTESGFATAGAPRQWAGAIPLDPRWMSLFAMVGIVAIGGLVVLIDSSLGALAATVTAAFFVSIGAVSIPFSALGLAGAVSVISIVGRDST
jgi:hypothetical protein